MAFRRYRGFTLIELMMTIAILAILVSIAYPGYIAYIQRARRAEATSSLAVTAQQLERCYTAFNSYTIADGCNPPPDLYPAATTDYQHYRVAITGRTATAYILTATPLAGSPQASDSTCTSFGMNQLGQRCANGLCEPAPGAAAEISKCWR